MAGSDSFLSDDDEDLCPLCIEEMDISDRNFKPCPCGYQICLFCYNNIRQNPELNGLCPACRREYDDESVEYKQVTSDEIRHYHLRQSRKERERKQRSREKKEAEQPTPKKHLAGMRVIQKNLVYVIGLNPDIPTNELHETLRSDLFFGQYGKIQKIVVNKRTNAAGNPGLGVYVTFARKEDAARCIAAVDGSVNDGKYLRAAYGTTKYCSAYLQAQVCQNPNCMFLHEPGEEADSYTRRDLSAMQHRHNHGSAGSGTSGGSVSSSGTPHQHQHQPQQQQLLLQQREQLQRDQQREREPQQREQQSINSPPSGLPSLSAHIPSAGNSSTMLSEWFKPPQLNSRHSSQVTLANAAVNLPTLTRAGPGHTPGSATAGSGAIASAAAASAAAANAVANGLSMAGVAEHHAPLLVNSLEPKAVPALVDALFEQLHRTRAPNSKAIYRFDSDLLTAEELSGPQLAMFGSPLVTENQRHAVYEKCAGLLSTAWGVPSSSEMPPMTPSQLHRVVSASTAAAAAAPVAAASVAPSAAPSAAPSPQLAKSPAPRSATAAAATNGPLLNPVHRTPGNASTNVRNSQELLAHMMKGKSHSSQSVY